jgi:hypothetical protein
LALGVDDTIIVIAIALTAVALLSPKLSVRIVRRCVVSFRVGAVEAIVNVQNHLYAVSQAAQAAAAEAHESIPTAVCHTAGCATARQDA